MMYCFTWFSSNWCFKSHVEFYYTVSVAPHSAKFKQTLKTAILLQQWISSFSIFIMHSASQSLEGLLLIKLVKQWVDQDVVSLDGRCGWYCYYVAICHYGHRHQWELRKGRERSNNTCVTTPLYSIWSPNE